MSVSRSAVRRFATSARLRNTSTQGQVYTPKAESMPVPPPQQQQQPYTPPQPQQVGTAGNVPVEKPVGGLR